MKFAIAAGLAAIVSTGAAQAADKPVVGAPPASWVTPMSQPKIAPAADGEAVKILVYDSQVHFGPEGASNYVETQFQLQTAQGLSAVGNVGLIWNPDLDQAVVHKLHIIRDGQVIDVLAKQSFTVLRRETNLELATLDGMLTAALQPEDLRVGDVLDFAWTITHTDPSLGGRAEAVLTLPNAEVANLRVIGSSEGAASFRWRATPGLEGVMPARTGEGAKVSVELKDVQPLRSPEGAPARYLNLRQVEMTGFKSWADVSAIMAPLFTKAEVLPASSPLNAEIARIKGLSPDPKVRAQAALQLVQEQIRYLNLAMNVGGLVPATADQTWSRRFGDCKGKTVLLLTLLHGLGIEAQPAIVNVQGGDGLDVRLPTVEIFNHVLVRAVIGGRVYWLDGARTGDHAIDDIATPPFFWALPLQTSGAVLTKLVVAPYDTPSSVVDLHLDASAGLDAPAKAHAEMVIKGDLGQVMKDQLSNLSSSQTEDVLKTVWKQRYDFIKPNAVSAHFDPQTQKETISMDGVATLAWDVESSSRRYEADGAVLGWKEDFSRLDGTDKDAPFLVNFPIYDEVRETIILPQGGQGFTVEGEDIDRKVAGRAFHRVSKIDKGVFTLVASTRSLVPEFPAAEADAAAKVLKDLSTSDVYVRAPANYKPNVAELNILKTADPTNSNDYITRA